jgi:hypothetical protein
LSAINSKKGGLTASEQAIKYAWKKTPSKDGEPHTIMFESRPYHWCATHEAWTTHTPAECEGINFKPKGDGKKTGTSKQIVSNAATVNEPTSDVKKNPVVKVNEALRAYIETIDELID